MAVESIFDLILAELRKINGHLGTANIWLDTIATLLQPDEDVASLRVSVGQPHKQGVSEMPGTIKKLGVNATVSMLDDQMALMSVSPLNEAGQPATLPTGSLITYKAVPGTAVTLNPGIDPSSLSCEVLGVKGQAGSEVVTATFINPDNSTATGEATFTMSIDPAELGDVTEFNVSVSTPVPQTASHPAPKKP